LAISAISTAQHSFVNKFQEAFLNFANHCNFINFSWGTDGAEVLQAQNEHTISTLSTLSLTCRGFSSPKSISSQYNFSASHGKMSIASAQRNSFVFEGQTWHFQASTTATKTICSSFRTKKTHHQIVVQEY
jgi:hypothetical protein